jgi:DNA-binding beta-propeller fold protein YncE
VTSTVAVGAVPVGVAVNPLTNVIYVTNFRAASVSVLTG